MSLRPGVIAVLAAALLLLLVSHPLVHGDGISYFIYLDSIAGDHDLDLTNQTVRFRLAIIYPLSRSPVSGMPVTAFPFGSAYLLAPFYWLGGALEPAVPQLRMHAAYFAARQGRSLAFSVTAALGALLYTLAAVWLAYRAARSVAPDWAAALAAVACLAGTPLLYYATVESLDAHAYGAFLVALALWLATRGVGSATPLFQRTPASFNAGRTLAVGLVLGMATLVRWQLLLYALPTGAALLWRGASAPPRLRALAPVAAFAIGVGLFAGLCAVYFWRFFGAPFVIPNEAVSGQAFVGTPLRVLPQVLLDRTNG